MRRACYVFKMHFGEMESLRRQKINEIIRLNREAKTFRHFPNIWSIFYYFKFYIYQIDYEYYFFNFSYNAHLTREFHLINTECYFDYSFMWWKNDFFFSFFGWKLWVYIKRWTFDIWQIFELHVVYAIIIDLSAILISSHVYNIWKNYIFKTLCKKKRNTMLKFVYVFIL